MMKLRKMAGIVLWMSAFLLPAGLMAQKAGDYQCQWYSSLKPEDGAAFFDRMKYDDKSKLMYYLSNDEERLFIEIVIADRPTIQKIMMYGLNTWVNPDGKQRKNTGIRFPIPMDRGSAPPQPRSQAMDRNKMIRESMEARNREMVIFGFEGMEGETLINPSLDQDFSGAISRIGEDRVLIALSLPLEKLGRIPGQNMNNPFCVGFETGYLDLNKQGMGIQSGQMQGGGPPSGGHPPGDGGRSESMTGRPGGTGPGSQANLSQMSKPAKLWIKSVKLAEPGK